jgi:glycerophosphoryl diester phosphodiesterase
MKTFGNKFITISIIITILFLLFYLNSDRHLSLKFKISDTIINIFDNKFEYQHKLIAHAGGGIDKTKYTNSEEAVLLSIKKGFKLIELDLIITKDNKIVAANNWDLFRKYSKCCVDTVPSLKEFNEIKILNKYTPLDSKKINEIFFENKDLILITDKIENFDLINNSFNFDKSRIIVEIFTRENYFKAIKKGIKNPLYSATIEHRKDEKKFIKNHKIPMISISSSEFIKYKEYFIKLKKDLDIIIFVYTTNDPQLVKVSENSADAFYTDFINISNMQCESNNCDTY